MATSGTTAFLQTRDQIIRRAGRQIGAWQSREVPGDDELADWSTALNAMIKEWQADGLHIWKESEATLFLVPGQIQYAIGPGTTNRIVRSFAQLTGAYDMPSGSSQIIVGYSTPLLSISMPADLASDFNLDEGVASSDLTMTESIVPIAFSSEFDFEFQGGPPLATSTVTTPGAYSILAGQKVTIGDPLGIFQTDGSIFWTQVSGFGNNSSLLFNGSLPIGAQAGGVVITYPAGQPVDRPLRILDARRYDILSQQEVSLNIMSRLDYRDMPNKFTAGFPNSIFYDPQLGDGQLWVWSPQAATSSGSGRTTLLNYTYMRSIESFLNAKDTPDFPEEWLNALTWNLALEMAPEYGAPDRTVARVEKRAMAAKDAVMGFDREPESIFVGVNFSGSSR